MAGWLALFAASSVSAVDGVPHLAWRLRATAGDAGGVTALTSQSGRPLGVEKLAWGNERGFVIAPAGARIQRFSSRAPVRDLSFDAGGTLWVATDAGLLRTDPVRPSVTFSGPVGNELTRAVARVVAAGNFTAIATGNGVFWRAGEGNWRRVDGALGAAPATGLALSTTVPAGRRERSEGPPNADLWISGERGLFRAELGGPERRVVARAVPLPAHPRPLLDVFVEESSLWVLAEKRLLEASLPALSAGAGDGASTRWLSRRLPLPPGATPVRLAASRLGAFLATDRGLLIAATPRGPWLRAPAPAGTLAATDVEAGADWVAVATRRGLVVGEVKAGRVAAAPAERKAPIRFGGAPTACEPPIGAVHRAALAYLKLQGDPLARQRRNARRRGYLPELRLEGAYASGDDRNSEFDQSFVSGATRELFDWDHRSDRERKIAVVLNWDFGDVLYDPEEIDISAEARRLVELRDDVLDEVNQLYFDRLRALRQAEAGGDSGGEAARHDAALRARELAAGLDAWTGGWFGAQLAACPPG